MPRTRRDRKTEVLRALVRLFVERQEPVSSRMLEQSGQLDIKSASIRSVLHELERDGLLVKPHASSGRIPTDAGYRAYVATLRMDENDSVDPRAMEEVGRAVREAGEDLDQMLHAVQRTLGRFSRNIAILAGPRDKSPRIVGVELYQRDSRHVCVVVELEGGMARTELVELEREVLPEGVIAAASLLGTRLAGRTLDEVREAFEPLVPAGNGPADQLAREVAVSARRIFSSAGLLRFSFEGLNEALRQPEFADPERLKALLEVMAGSEELETVLESELRPRPGDVTLTIGRENPVPALHPFSLLATRFELNDQVGYLAVLGPRRMHYPETAALVRLIARRLEQLGL